MRKNWRALGIYAVLILASLGAAWIASPWLLGGISSSALGAGLAVVFAALYIGELKQESIGQLYQALASANLRSAELVCFSSQALAKIRCIRRIFLFSNIVKLLGALAAVYLANEKNAEPELLVAALRASLSTLLLSMVLFARLWAEVSFTEGLLISVKQEAQIQARREAFQNTALSAKSYDFDSDPAARSFETEAKSELTLSESH